MIAYAGTSIYPLHDRRILRGPPRVIRLDALFVTHWVPNMPWSVV